MTDIQIPQWVTDFNDSDARFKIAHGGRLGGRSFGFTYNLVQKAKYKTLKIAYMGSPYGIEPPSIRGLPVINMINRLGMARDFYQSIDKQVVMSTHMGSTINFPAGVQMAPDLKAYYDTDIFYVDNAQNLRDDAFQTILCTVKKRGSQIWFNSNPAMDKEMNSERLYDKQNRPELYDHIWEGQLDPTKIPAAT